MTAKFFKCMSVTIGLIIIAIFLLSPVASAADKLVIGHTYPITGTTAESGLEIVRGCKAAVAAGCTVVAIPDLNIFSKEFFYQLGARFVLSSWEEFHTEVCQILKIK